MNNDQQIGIRIDSQLKKALQEIAEEKRTTISQILKTLAVEFARKEKKIK
jgi:antitoxin component of RelBE/YafQ-DinJ toxin-antitoxin module|tara:strand:- start:33 stop:182 length:150 start_codon:yes stop_codon:yes gene_type:complete